MQRHAEGSIKLDKTVYNTWISMKQILGLIEVLLDILILEA